MFSVLAFCKACSSALEQNKDIITNNHLAIYLKSIMPAELTTSLSETLAEYNNKAFIISSAKDDGLSTACTVDIPSGPYFMSAYTGQLFQAYRLYSDFEGAFTEGVIATEGGNYSVMSAAIQVTLRSDIEVFY